MINVNYCYNIYIDIPESILTNNIDYCYLHVQIYKVINGIEELYLDFDSGIEEHLNRYYYNFSLFDKFKKTWNPFKIGLIDNSKYSRIAIKNVNERDIRYRYKYYFYASSPQNNEQIIVSDIFQVLPVDEKPIVQDLKFKVCVAQLVNSNDITLTWDAVNQLDNERVEYNIQIRRQHDKEIIFEDSVSDVSLYRLANINFIEEILYSWRVRSIDSFGKQLLINYGVEQFRGWSDWYSFKKIKEMFFSATVCNRFYSSLTNLLLVTTNNQKLCHRIFVYGTTNVDLQNLVCVTAKNQQLNFRIYCDGFTNVDLQNFVCVTAKNQQLRMQILNMNTTNVDLQNFVYVTAKNQQLYFKIEIMPILHFQLTVRSFKELNYFVNVGLLSDLNFSFPIWKQFVWEKPMTVRIVKDLQPFVVYFYNESGQLVKTDNRIKLYDKDKKQIIPFDKFGLVKNVYPYVAEMPNNEIQVYDSFGKKINEVYDIDGNLIQVYDNNNLIKNWLPVGKYYARYFQYEDAVYFYRFDRTQLKDFSVRTTSVSLNLNANSSGTWRLYIAPYVQQKPLFEHAVEQFLYINEMPQECIPPFYIDNHLLINNNVLIYNSRPTFSFNPVVSKDSDIIRYHLMVSKNFTFSTNIVDVYIDNSNSMINYDFKQEQLIQEQGVYYIYLATCDYSGDEKKSQIRAQYDLSFEYKFLYSEITSVCKIVDSNWIPIAYQLIVRNRFQLNCQTLIMRWSDSYQNSADKDIHGFIRIANWLTPDQQQLQCYQLPGVLTVTSKSDLYFSTNIRQYSVLRMGVVNQKVYGIIGEFDFDGFIRVVYSTQNPQYDNDDSFNVKFKLNVRYQIASDLDLFKILVGRRSENILYNKCQVWNDKFHPIKNRQQLGVRALVSNWMQPQSALLRFSLKLRYPQPPIVAVVANVPQMVWQNNYKIEYNLSLISQSIVPFSYYQYVFSIKDKNVSFDNCQKNFNGFLKIDIRDKLFELSGKQTGILYLYVRSVNQKLVRSSYITTYCIFYNNVVSAPIIQYINGEYVVGNQRPIINYTKQFAISWSRVYDSVDVGDAITYQLQMSVDYKFSQVDYQVKQIIGNVYTIAAKQIPAGLYYCRVRAYDQNQYSQWSLIAMCYINKAPNAPTDLRVKNII